MIAVYLSKPLQLLSFSSSCNKDGIEKKRFKEEKIFGFRFDFIYLIGYFVFH